MVLARDALGGRRRRGAGGQIYRQADPALHGAEYAEASERRRKHALLDRFARAPGIEYRAGTLVFAIFAGPELHVAENGATEALRPDAVVLATGVREMAIPFPGWTLPGVMLAGGAQAVLKAQGTLPGRSAVIAGAGPLPMVFAAQFLRAGGAVAALAMLNSPMRALRDPAALLRGWEISGEGLRYAATVLRHRVPLLTRWMPVRALGSDRLEAVVLRQLGPDGTLLAREREIACDLLAVNYGFAANSELAALAGARMRRDPVGGRWVPVVDDQGRTSVAGVFSAGDAAGLRGAAVAESDGRVVGAAAADAQPSADAVRRRRQYAGFAGAVRTMLQVPDAAWQVATDDTIVCRCENVTRAEIAAAVADGHCTPNAVKRNTRAAMGWCGGRMCLHSIEAITENMTGVVPDTMMTPRPMVRPVSFAALANRRAEERVK